MFCMLCQFYSPFPAFLDLVMELGFKTSDIEDNTATCSRRIHMSEEDGSIESYEVAYSVRHMEEHCRNELADPWSLRHAVVYQRYCFGSGCSTWILFQVPGSIQGQLQRAFSGSRFNCPALPTARPHPAALHALFLVSSQRNWDSYLKYLNKQYSEMNDMACFSNVSRNHQRDYALDFSNCQLLECLRSKLRRAFMTLDAHSNIIKSVMQLSKDISKLSASSHQLFDPSQSEFQMELQQHMDRIKSHKQRLSILLASSESTCRILFKILDYRNDEVVHQNVFSLNNFASAASGESRSMLCVTQNARNDSKIMRVASLIALVYLPATLIATIFSSSLVQPPPESSGSRSVSGRSISLFLGLTGGLTVFTVTAAYLWGRRGERGVTIRTSD